MFEFTFSSTDLSLSGIELSSTETLCNGFERLWKSLLEESVCNVSDGVCNGLKRFAELLLDKGGDVCDGV